MCACKKNKQRQPIQMVLNGQMVMVQKIFWCENNTNLLLFGSLPISCLNFNFVEWTNSAI